MHAVAFGQEQLQAGGWWDRMDGEEHAQLKNLQINGIPARFPPYVSTFVLNFLTFSISQLSPEQAVQGSESYFPTTLFCFIVRV